MAVKRFFRSTFNAKFWLLVSVSAAIVVVVHRFHLQSSLQAGWYWLTGLGTSDPLTFIVFFNLATLICVPASLLAIQAGFVFGWGWGSLYVLVGAIVGATLAFLVGRYFTQQWVWQKVNANVRFCAIAQAVAQEGWKIVLLTRLSPIFPFNLTNYAFGITKISLRHYVLGSLGILPGTVLYTYIGSLASELSQAGLSNTPLPLGVQMGQWGLRLVGLVATIAIMIYLHRVAKKALNQRMEMTLEVSDSSQKSMP
jgi:uncharacterized membrane protein YdjX (TVP38/TMEM64 family)